MTGQTRTTLLAAATLGLALTAGGASGEEEVEGYAEFYVDACLVVGRAEGLPRARSPLRGRGCGLELRHDPPRIRSEGEERPSPGRRDGPGAPPGSQAQRHGPLRGPGPGRHRPDGGQHPPGRSLHRRPTECGSASWRPGHEVDRVRWIVDSLLPDYLAPSDVRVYVIENKEWNAFAMGNYSIYVFSGLLDDLDDDEVAIVLGHELVHATHEHSRRQVKKDMWVQLRGPRRPGRHLHHRPQGSSRRWPRPPPGSRPRPGATATGARWRTRPTGSGSATRTRQATTSRRGRSCGSASRRSTARETPP